MRFSIKLDHDLKIVSYTHSGKIELNDIGSAWQQFLSMPEFTEQKYNLLSDYRDAVFNFPSAMVKDILDYLVNLEHILRGKKQVLLVDNPGNTAISMLLEADVNFKIGFIVRVFTDEQAALNWLLL